MQIPSFDLGSSSSDEDEAPVECSVQPECASAIHFPVTVETVSDAEAAVIEAAMSMASGARSGETALGRQGDGGGASSASGQAGAAAESGSSGVLAAQLPERLFSALLPFQRDGVKFVLSKNGRACIGDEMGLGKTLQAIAVARCLSPQMDSNLVVAFVGDAYHRGDI